MHKDRFDLKGEHYGFNGTGCWREGIIIEGDIV
jgi:hypothetical protein